MRGTFLQNLVNISPAIIESMADKIIATTFEGARKANIHRNVNLPSL